MSKKMKVLVAVVVAVVLLTAGFTATALAQEEPEPKPKPGDAFLARVAKILGVSEDELVNAFKQAREEMRQAAFDKWLQKAVERGIITEEKANQIKEWWAQRPEAVNKLMPGGFFGARGGRGAPMWDRGWGAYPGVKKQIRQRLPPAMRQRMMPRFFGASESD